MSSFQESDKLDQEFKRFSFIVKLGFGAAAMLLVVNFLIGCWKKAGIIYARIATNDSEKFPPAHHSSPSQAVSNTSQAPSPGPYREQLNELRNLTTREYTSEELVAITKTYKEKLGSGGYGDVYRGKLQSGILVAVKVLKYANDKRTGKQFLEEVRSIGGIRHINLIKLYGYCFDQETWALVYEYMEKKSLDKFLIGDMTEIDWPKTHKIAVGTAKGIAYLHEESNLKIVHCVIKPGNILLDGNFSPKVADFGLAKLYKNGQISISGFRGTFNYAAPEMREANFVTYKCDVYSFGMLLLEIVDRRRNHNENQSESMLTLPQRTWHMHQNNELLEMVCWVPVEEREKAKNMLKVALLCITHKPDVRPEMSDVVKMLEGEKDIPTPEYPFKKPDLDNPYQGSGNGSE